MGEKLKKALTVALAAVLLFMTVTPVPTGQEAFDRLRAEKAEAVAVPIAPIVIFGTALAAYGVYVAGTDAQTYDANLSELYDAVCAAGNYTSQRFDELLSGAVDENGNIDLGYLAGQGMFGLLPVVIANMMNSGTAVQGETSHSAVHGYVTIDGHNFVSWDGVYPSVCEQNNNWAYLRDECGMTVFGLSATPGTTDYQGHSGGTSYITYWYHPDEQNIYEVLEDSNGYYLYARRGNTSKPYTKVVSISTRVFDDGYVSHNFHNTKEFKCYENEGKILLSPSATYPGQNIQSVTQTGVIGDTVAAVSAEVAAGTAAAPTSVVEPFEPTAAQLEAGYSSADVVDAISSNTGAVDNVLNFLQANFPILGQILSAIIGVATNVGTLVANWANLKTGPFSWLASWWQQLTAWWSALLEWAGDTPIGQVIGGAVGALEGAVSDVGVAVGGVLGSLQGWWSGLLDWLGDTPIAQLIRWLYDLIASGVADITGALSGVVGAIQDALAGVLDGLLDLAGTIEGLLQPFLNPTLTDTGETTQLVLPPLLQPAEIDLSNKVPFCYLVRSYDALTSMLGNFRNNRSFYFDLQIPYSNSNVRFNGEAVLSQQFGPLDIAQTIRALVTGLLCLGLLYRAYKMIERRAL